MDKENDKVEISRSRIPQGSPRSLLDEALIWGDNIEAIIYSFYSSKYTKEEVIALFSGIVENEYEDYKRTE